MSSTNKTTNYELSQFIGSDKPAWLGDYNTDMGKIDTGIHTAQTTATGADGKADANTTAIGTLENLTTDVKTSLVAAINEVDGHADTAQTSANNAYSLSTATATALNGLIGKFSFTSTVYNATTPNSRAISSNASFGEGGLTVAINSDSSMFKCYGSQRVNVSAGGDVTITLPVASLTVDASYDIEGGITAIRGDGTYINEVKTGKIKVSNGQIQIEFNGVPTGVWAIWSVPCLYLNKDFGD